MANFLNSFIRCVNSLAIAIYRDIYGAFLLIQSRLKLRRFEKQNETIFEAVSKVVRRNPNKTCFIFEDRIWTFKDVETYALKIAGIFQKKFGLKKGDCVALFMENKPEFVGIWLGLSKLGVITALINTNLKNEPLLHSIDVAKACLAIIDSNLEESFNTVVSKLAKNLPLVVEGDRPKKTNAVYLNDLIDEQSVENVEPNEPVYSTDTIVYIYTSGTTGLPKPAVINHIRFYGGGIIFFKAAGLTTSDIVYVSLPIYHSNGGVLGVGSAILSGATVVLRRKFSASQFWRDCIRHNCTAFFYVGEICRYLVNQQKSELDRAHKIKRAIGNGMRRNIWIEFMQRFGNIKFCEVYGASEGNCAMINIVNKMGSCGFAPLLNKIVPVFPVFVIRVDSEMNPIRDKNGFLIRCAPNEKGLLIGIIRNNPVNAFSGYANNSEASKTKVLENVFKKGQKAFNSGDLMIQDALGYFYFCDRLGDTFRWRGENVSTIEVENAISRNLNSSEVVVYGVEVPGQEGKAGMAALNCQPESVDLASLGVNLKLDLPSYAKPVFIRFANELEHTGTFKAIKMKLIEECYNVKVVKDPMFYYDLKDNLYKLLTKTVYENILNGDIRL